MIQIDFTEEDIKGALKK